MATMGRPDTAAITNLLTYGPHRQEVGRKQLTLAFGGLYIASTTLSAKPALVWETEKGYPRYYVPTESLHADIRSRLTSSDSDGKANGHKSSVDVVTLETVKGKGTEARAIIEQLTLGSKSTTWVRFVEGQLKGLVRFERSEIGKYTLVSSAPSMKIFEQFAENNTQMTGSRTVQSSLESRILISASTLFQSHTISL
jgi:hypothetical protein